MKWQVLRSKKWLILGLIAVLVSFYQNMSPHKGWKSDEFDIRESAPAKPDGYFEDPLAAYFPAAGLGSGSLGDLSQGLLSHNLNPLLERTEYFGLSLFSDTGTHYGSLEGSGRNFSAHRGASSPWHLQVINPQKMRVTYSIESGVQVSCDAESGQGLQLSMLRPISSNMNIGLSHQVERQSSQIQMDLRW